MNPGPVNPTRFPVREREIFLGALEYPPGRERDGYLDSACAGDAALRRAVEGLLGDQGHAEGFLEDPALASLRARPSERAGDPGSGVAALVAERIGDRIGRYRLLEQIGEGGCGVVFMAEQEEPVRRRVALKIIKPGMDTRSVIARFEAERQALAMMDHPNIARVFDAGCTDTGRPYFVMELVRGARLTEYCDRYRLTTSNRLQLFIEVCQAVQHAHQKGIIHRDLKPSNILVTLHDGVPVPKVIDFGIAKATEQRLTDKTLFTEFRAFLGTPAYMSPEQAEMSGLDIDTRSDIYSLGVLLYEVLTGRPPFDPDTLLRGGVDAIRRTLREVEPTRPSNRVATLSAPDLTTTASQRCIEAQRLVHLLRGDLDWIAMKCLEKDRTRRYSTANDLALDLGRYLDNEPVLARPPTAFYRLQKLLRRHRLVVGAVAGVALALVTGTAISLQQAIRARAAEATQSQLRQIAESERRRAEVESAAARLSEYVSDINLAQQAWPTATTAGPGNWSTSIDPNPPANPTCAASSGVICGGNAGATNTSPSRPRTAPSPASRSPPTAAGSPSDSATASASSTSPTAPGSRACPAAPSRSPSSPMANASSPPATPPFGSGTSAPPPRKPRSPRNRPPSRYPPMADSSPPSIARESDSAT
jgi:serine/threonine protein kinase